MKFNMFSFKEVKANEKIPFRKGRLWLRLSAPAALYLESEGVEVLAGIAPEFDLDLAEPGAFTVAGEDGLRVFLFVPDPTSVRASGEVFTNIDRLPDESGNLSGGRRSPKFARSVGVCKTCSGQCRFAPIRPLLRLPPRLNLLLRGGPNEAGPSPDALVAALRCGGSHDPPRPLPGGAA
jgi:hypothetical protein